jgi:DNA-binding transcriptional LysR family regulator
MPNVDLDSRLALFADVIEAGSFSEAARQRRASRAAVAKQIAGLEDQLGTRLLNRSTRRMSPTDVGRTLYAHAARVREELREIRAVVEDARAEVSGVLRVTSVVHFGRLHVQPVAMRLVQQHTGLRIDLTLEDRVEDLIAGGFDVGVRIGKPADSTLIARHLADVDVVICAAESYLARRGTPAHPAELADHDCVVYASDEVVVDSWQYLDRGRVRSVKVGGRYQVNLGELLMDAVAEGLGIGLLPRFLADEALRDGRLVALLADVELPPYAPLHAIYPARQHMPRKTRVFLDALLAQVGAPPRWRR